MVNVHIGIVICTVIMVFAPIHDLSATGSNKVDSHRGAKHESRSGNSSAYEESNNEANLFHGGVSNLACRIPIKPDENREIIIMKLQQRMDCMEIKLNHLNSMMGIYHRSFNFGDLNSDHVARWHVRQDFQDRQSGTGSMTGLNDDRDPMMEMVKGNDNLSTPKK